MSDYRLIEEAAIRAYTAVVVGKNDLIFRDDVLMAQKKLRDDVGQKRANEIINSLKSLNASGPF